MAEEPELTGLDSDSKTATLGGTTGGTGEETSLGSSGSSGARRRTDPSGRKTKCMNNVLTIRQNTVAQFIATRLILGLCEVTESPNEMLGTDGD